MNQIIANAPTSAAVVAGTVVSGTAGWLDLIPDDISKLSALAGIFLSIILGYYHIRLGNAKLKKMGAEFDSSKLNGKKDSSLVLGWYHIKIGNAKLKQMQAELDNSESGRDGAK